MITWKDTINIIVQMFDCNQQTIANQLGVEKSHFSKVKSGKLNAPAQFASRHIYSRIFDVNMSVSLAYGENAKSLLQDLKLIVDENFKNVKLSMTDCWDGCDYQTFVMNLLERTRQPPAISSKNISSELRHILPEKPLLFGRETEMGEITDAFNKGNYAIITGIGGIGKSQVALAYPTGALL